MDSNFNWRDIVTQCPTHELFSVIWRCYGWGVIVLVGPIVLVVSLIGLAVEPAEFGTLILILLLTPFIAFGQGVIIALLIIGGRGAYRSWFLRGRQPKHRKGAA